MHSRRNSSPRVFRVISALEKPASKQAVHAMASVMNHHHPSMNQEEVPVFESRTLNPKP
jgi:hypothetical protein